MKPAKDNTGVPEKEVKVKYLVYLMEKATASCDESKGIDKIIWLIDFKVISQTFLTLTSDVGSQCSRWNFKYKDK